MSFVTPAIELVSLEDKSVLFLRGSFNLADASALHEAAVLLVGAAEQASSNTNGGAGLDVTGVGSVDVGILQILSALEAELARRDRPFFVQGISEALAAQCAAAGWSGFAQAA